MKVRITDKIIKKKHITVWLKLCRIYLCPRVYLWLSSLHSATATAHYTTIVRLVKNATTRRCVYVCVCKRKEPLSNGQTISLHVYQESIIESIQVFVAAANVKLTGVHLVACGWMPCMHAMPWAWLCCELVKMSISFIKWTTTSSKFLWSTNNRNAKWGKGVEWHPRNFRYFR